MQQEEILVKSTLDGTMQPSLLYRTEGNRPLLVGLHTWSFDRFNQAKVMPAWAEKYGFHLLLPQFRGSNLPSNPNCREACGSLLAKQDIIDAIDRLIADGIADPDNIFLLGASGVGHMALLMAGYRPEYFKAIGAFVPITDLKKWSEENSHYRPHIMACCDSDEQQMLLRSPCHYKQTILKANLKIFHGKYDSVVPVTQSLTLFADLMAMDPKARIFLDIFDGGHEIDMKTAEYWLLSQYQKFKKTSVTG